jgi:hypothetical protein
MTDDKLRPTRHKKGCFPGNESSDCEICNPKIRPCPFCGEIPTNVTLVTMRDYKEIHSQKCPSFQCYSTLKTVKNWNSAYCWKQLSSAQEKIKRLREALEKILSEVPLDELRTATELRIGGYVKNVLADTEEKP